MPGVPGAGGPPPKRANQRRRVNKPVTPVTVAPTKPATFIPPGDPAWHHLAFDWYEALSRSGQSAFYTDGDWQTARIAADLLSGQLSAVRPSAVMIQAWWSMSTSLLVTEGDRRRARIELERVGVEETTDDVSELSDYRRRLNTG